MSGIILEEAPSLVSNELGPQCSNCTHYKGEHNGPNNHCMHVIASGKIDEAKDFEAAGFYVPDIIQRCPCKVFKS